MADTRYWPKEFLTKFIEKYKSYPCLWKIKSKEYTNKNLKNVAYESLVEMCRNIYPEANRDFVVKKIQSLRGSFRKELKRVTYSKTTGTSADGVYTPSLWYFDLLLFTKDQEIPTESVCNIENENEEFDNNNMRDQGLEEDKLEFSEVQDQEGEREIIECNQNTKQNILQRGKKRQHTSNNESKEFLEMCNTALESQNKIVFTEFDAVGICIAKKLQRMDSTQSILAESIINNVLTKGLLGSLSTNSKLCDGACIDALNLHYSTNTTPRASSAISYILGGISPSVECLQNFSAPTVHPTENNSEIANETAASYYQHCSDFLNDNSSN
ncbi:hypothetical protein FQR65_LT00351 [Abscondita terminalis]|nr:hypothetical protein FQR65_LT00351 [Abscondita terminalis]